MTSARKDWALLIFQLKKKEKPSCAALERWEIYVWRRAFQTVMSFNTFTPVGVRRFQINACYFHLQSFSLVTVTSEFFLLRFIQSFH